MSETHLSAVNGSRATEWGQPDRAPRCAAEVIAEKTMEIFVHQRNLMFFRKQLAEPQDDERRRRLTKLLAEEEAKGLNSSAEREAC